MHDLNIKRSLVQAVVAHYEVMVPNLKIMVL